MRQPPRTTRRSYRAVTTGPEPESSVPWSEADADHLFTVAGLDATPLRVIPVRTRWALIASGDLPAIHLGARRYIRKAAIVKFLAERERAGRGEQ